MSSHRYMCVTHNKMLYGIKNVNRHHFLFHEKDVAEAKIRPNEISQPWIAPSLPQSQPIKTIKTVEPKRGGWHFKQEPKYICPFPGCGKKLYNPQSLIWHGRLHDKQYAMSDAIKTREHPSTATLEGKRQYQINYRAKKKQELEELRKQVQPQMVINSDPQNLPRENARVPPSAPVAEIIQPAPPIPTQQSLFQPVPTMDQIIEAMKERGLVSSPILEKKPDPEPIQTKRVYTKKMPCPYCENKFLSTQSLKVHVMGRHIEKIVDFLKTLPTPVG